MQRNVEIFSKYGRGEWRLRGNVVLFHGHHFPISLTLLGSSCELWAIHVLPQASVHNKEAFVCNLEQLDGLKVELRNIHIHSAL